MNLVIKQIYMYGAIVGARNESDHLITANIWETLASKMM